MVVPLLASFEAGNATDTLVQSLMDDDTPDNIKGAVDGASEAQSELELLSGQPRRNRLQSREYVR